MIGKNWLYYLIDANGLSYYVENGIVKTSNFPKPLTYTPDGWQDVLIGWERNWEKYGISRNYTNPLSYVKDGAMIMRHIFFTQNIEAKVYLLMQKKTLDLTSTDFSFVYQYFYKGEHDFSTYQQLDREAGRKITMGIMEGGAAKFLVAKSDTIYEVPCNKYDGESIKVRMDGVQFYNKINFTIPDVPYDLKGPVTTHTIPISLINEEGDSFGVYRGSQSFEELTKEDDVFVQSSQNFFFTSVQPIKIKITGSITYKNIDTNNITISAYFLTSNGQRIFLINEYLLLVGDIKTVDFDITLDLIANETLFLFGNILEFDRPFHLFFEMLQTNISIETTTRLSETLCYARRPLSLFQELIGRMQNDAYQGISNLLAANKHLVITSGKAIRGFEDAIIKTTFNDFFKTHSYLHMAGLEYNDTAKKVGIESITKYFDASNPIHLGKVNNLKISSLKDQMFNLLDIGYISQDYNSVNGLREFNTTTQMSTPITRIVKKLEKILPYRSDCYGIEILRKNYRNLDTTDSSSDDAVFILNIEDEPDANGIYNLRRIKYDAISGVILDDDGNYSVYNIEDLTPKRLLYKNGPLLRSLLWGFDQEYLKFQTSNKNQELSTTLNGITITENADEEIYKLGDLLFKPLKFEFEPKAYPGLIDLLNANPNRCFSFEYNDEIYKGFNLKVGIAPNDNETQVFSLLSTADNDLTKLTAG